MYVCVCNAVTERDLRNAARRGAVSLADVQHELGVASCCGSCAPFAEEILSEVQCSQGLNEEPMYYAVG